MAQNRRWISATVILALVCLTVAGVMAWPDLLSRATYAIERGQAQAAQQQLGVATDLSQAFQYVARSLRPSVVSISSVRRVQVAQPQVRRYGSEMPNELRRFFGDDELLDRFFFDAPVPPRGFEQHGLGSGVIVSSDGYILTNNHVIQGADEVTVTLSDNRQLPADVVGADKATDVAVLKVDAKDLHPAQLGDSSSLNVGQWALAVGSPFGLDQTVTAGIISAVGRANVGITDYEDFIQTDAAINPGNSGGPLVNLQGEVIGINTAIASRNGGYQGVGFAIPSNMARHVMDSIVENGSVTRGYLGAYIQDLNTDLAKSFGFDSSEGVLVSDVMPGGPADKAGLKAGDIITKLNGKKATSSSQLRNAVAATDPHTKMKVEIYRDGSRQTLAVEIGKLDEDQVAMAAPGAASNDQLGINVETLTGETARQLGYDRDERGVVVTQVDPSGLAARTGIRRGDIVVAIDDSAIDSVADFRDAVRKHDLKDGIRMQIMRDGARRYVYLRSR